MFTITELKTACKQHGIDPTAILETLKANKQPKESRPFWKEFVAVFDQFYLSEKKEQYLGLEKEVRVMGEIYDLLRKRCELKKCIWDEQNACNGFLMYLKRAYSKDDFLKNNFTPKTILSQFNSILNYAKSPNNIQSRRPAVDMQSAYSKLNSFTD